MRRAVLWYSVRNRNRKADAITAFLARESAVGLILVGISPARQRNEGILERRLAEQTDILSACDILPCPSSPWPFVQTDARQLPYRDRAAGCVVSNAVIEHVGGLEDQRAFVAEHQRVGEAWVITTPNRWFPVESHTSVLFRHWSPRWRAARPAAPHGGRVRPALELHVHRVPRGRACLTTWAGDRCCARGPSCGDLGRGARTSGLTWERPPARTRRVCSPQRRTRCGPKDQE